MSHSTVLDLAAHYQFGSPAHTRRPSPLILTLCVLAALLAVAGALARPYLLSPASDKAVVRIPLEQEQFIASLNIDDKAELIVQGADAEARNAAIPVSERPVEHVGQFTLAGGAYPTALRCLTQAVYYEAAVEPLQGRRAVAQVILNRMRHPAYPHSVCGVVYQGAEKRTGCQFSFTCDGSLLRAPSAIAWREAESVARDALAGRVEPSVGTATHYHADYVLPKWAFQLGKIAQIGRHIFYRFNGGWGNATSLRQAYSGHEYIPALNFAAMRDRLEEGAATTTPVGNFVPGLTVPPAVSDRHSQNDVGGRIDMTKEWRLTIPDPVEASSRYRAAVGQVPERNAAAAAAKDPASTTATIAVAETSPASSPAPGHEVAAR